MSHHQFVISAFYCNLLFYNWKLLLFIWHFNISNMTFDIWQLSFDIFTLITFHSFLSEMGYFFGCRAVPVTIVTGSHKIVTWSHKIVTGSHNCDLNRPKFSKNLVFLLLDYANFLLKIHIHMKINHIYKSILRLKSRSKKSIWTKKDIKKDNLMLISILTANLIDEIRKNGIRMRSARIW